MYITYFRAEIVLKTYTNPLSFRFSVCHLPDLHVRFVPRRRHFASPGVLVHRSMDHLHPLHPVHVSPAHHLLNHQSQRRFMGNQRGEFFIINFMREIVLTSFGLNNSGRSEEDQEGDGGGAETGRSQRQKGEERRNLGTAARKLRREQSW